MTPNPSQPPIPSCWTHFACIAMYSQSDIMQFSDIYFIVRVQTKDVLKNVAFPLWLIDQLHLC